MPRRAAVFAAVSLGALTACGRLGPTVSGVVDLAPPGAESLRITYLGTAGWVLQRGSDVVLTAPLFTNPGLVRTGLWAIRSDTALVDRHMSRVDASSALAILVGHGHYDHLMDVPRVAQRHAPGARIVASRTVKNTLGTWSGVADRVDVVNDVVGDQLTAGRWLRFGDGVRVMALSSWHAPHFEGVTLYSGTREHPLEREPAAAHDWLDGPTFAYLIDFLGSTGSVAFRVYFQDAVPAPPAGFAPDELVAERGVDVALLTPATFDQVDWHPEALIENLDPERVILGHWEDFFLPVDDPAESTRLTNLDHFEGRLRKVFDGDYWRPDRFTEFRIPSG